MLLLYFYHGLFGIRNRSIVVIGVLLEGCLHHDYRSTRSSVNGQENKTKDKDAKFSRHFKLFQLNFDAYNIVIYGNLLGVKPKGAEAPQSSLPAPAKFAILNLSTCFSCYTSVHHAIKYLFLNRYLHKLNI
jgi:hypothetical protein